MIDTEKEIQKLEAAVKKPAGRKPEKGSAAGSSPASGSHSRGSSRASVSGTLTLRLVKSGTCTPRDQKATLRGLGFRRLGQQVVREDSPAVRGMVRKVRHLVEVVKA